MVLYLNDNHSVDVSVLTKRPATLDGVQWQSWYDSREQGLSVLVNYSETRGTYDMFSPESSRKVLSDLGLKKAKKLNGRSIYAHVDKDNYLIAISFPDSQK